MKILGPPLGNGGKLKAGEASLWEHESNLLKKATLAMANPPPHRKFDIDPEKWWLEGNFSGANC